MRICIGISGSIAAYRSVEFVKELKKMGHEVRCILTRGGQEFVSARVLETFSVNRVLSADVFSTDHFSTDHIEAARWADRFVVYGASANFIARAALGFGDDFLSLQLLAFEGKKVLAPAMNPSMWAHPAVKKNVATLIEQGWTLVTPIAGEVACDEVGVGHLATHVDIFAGLFSGSDKHSASTSSVLPLSEIPSESAAMVASPLSASTKSASSRDQRASGVLAGKRVLISAGPMRTAVDSVRYLQNRSSGRMGLELARACREAGALEVKVLLGPVENEMQKQFLELFDVSFYESAGDYEKQLERLFPETDIFFSAAAVLDFELDSRDEKMERSHFEKTRELKVPLTPVKDIVAKFNSKKQKHQTVIAFAAESGSEKEIIERATQKMLKKGVDALIANPVWTGLGPDSESNKVWILRPAFEPKTLGPDLKSRLAHPILNALF